MSKNDEEVTNNDLTKARNPEPICYGIEFKFHVLQFILLLHGNNKFTSNNALNAYLYAKENFPKFFKNYMDEISLVMTLLLFQQPSNVDDQAQEAMIKRVSELILRMKEVFENEKDTKKNEHGEVLFISEILANFEHINSYHSVFVNVANDFISEYCKDLKLSNDSSLFQSILAGFLNLPSFYKYNKIQLKLNKSKTTENSATSKTENAGYLEAPYDYDIPFQLPDSNRFLFNYHPIFICPITKEQLVPVFSPENLHTNDPRYRKPQHHERQIVHNNPVVVLNFCQHLALKESVWQLSKKGTDIFKCHYCYKKHKFSDVTEAYFIDI